MDQPLSRRTKLLYGFGDTGFSLTSTILGAYFLIFLTDVVGLSPGAAGLAIFIGRSWDYINDPIFGYLSDRTRSRWGRRRPFLLFGPIPFALSFMLLWWHPPLGDGALVAYYALAYVLFDAAATLIYMPYFALTPELTSDYDERTSLTTYRMFFSIFGSLLAFTVPLLIIGSLTPGNGPRVLLMGVIFALISAAPFPIVFLATKENPQFSEQERPGLRESLRTALQNRPFLFGLGLFLMTWVTIDILQAGLLFYIKYVVQRVDQSDIVMATIFITAILMLPLWNWLAGRTSKRHAYIGGMVFLAAVLLALIALTPGTALPLVLVLCVLAGIGVASAHVLPWAIIPDAIEWGEWKTGQRQEGTLYSLVTLAYKVASSLALLGVSQVLEQTGYRANAPQQSPSALLGIRLVIGPIPAVLLMLGIVSAFLYPLGREEYQRVAEELKARRAAEAAPATTGE